MLIGWISSSIWQFYAFDSGLGRFVHDLVDWNADAWTSAGITLTAWGALLWLCLVFSATLLTHRAGDRSSRPRFAVALVWGLALAWMAGILLWAGQSDSQRASLLVAVGFFGVVMSLVVGFFTLTEDYALTPRQAQSIAGAHGWRRRASVLLGPGAARGRWYTLAFSFTAVALLVIATATTAGHDDHHTAILAWCTLGYGLLVLVVGDAVARHALSRWCTAPLHRRLTILAVMSAWSIVPALAGLLVSEDGLAYAVLRLLTPGWGVYHHAVEDTSDGFSGFGGVLLVLPLIMFAVVALQARRMTVVTRRVVAEAGDRNARA